MSRTQSREALREQLKRDREKDLKKERARKRLFPLTIFVILAIVVAVATTFAIVNRTPDEAYNIGDSAKDPLSEQALDDPYLEFGAKSNAPVVNVYLDFTCPYCGEFHQQSGQMLEDKAASSDITLRIHPRTFLADATSTKYSARAAIAFLAVYDNDKDHALKYMDLLFENQPREGGKGLTNEKLQELADEAGSSVNVVDAISKARGAMWLKLAVEVDADENTEGTPYVTVDDKPIENWRDTDALNSALSGGK